jgi:hypothetical protein
MALLGPWPWPLGAGCYPPHLLYSPCILNNSAGGFSLHPYANTYKHVALRKIRAKTKEAGPRSRWTSISSIMNRLLEKADFISLMLYGTGLLHCTRNYTVPWLSYGPRGAYPTPTPTPTTPPIRRSVSAASTKGGCTGPRLISIFLIYCLGLRPIMMACVIVNTYTPPKQPTKCLTCNSSCLTGPLRTPQWLSCLQSRGENGTLLQYLCARGWISREEGEVAYPWSSARVSRTSLTTSSSSRLPAADSATLESFLSSPGVSKLFHVINYLEEPHKTPSRTLSLDLPT